MSTVESSGSRAHIQVCAPRLLGVGTLVLISACGLVLLVPILAVMLFVTTLPFGPASFVIPVVAVACATWFLPFGFGNAYVAWRFRKLRPPPTEGARMFLAQLTLTPRLCDGFRALAEDADDFGWLTVTDQAVTWHGDAVQLSIPVRRIRKVELRTAGWRGGFVYGPRTAIEVPDLDQASPLEFAERSSWILPGSRRAARALYEALASVRGKVEE